MSGAVVQLVANGPHDQYFTSDVNRPPFAPPEAAPQTAQCGIQREKLSNVQGTVSPGETITIKIPRVADAVWTVMAFVKKKQGAAPLNSVSDIFENGAVMIGGREVERWDKRWGDTASVLFDSSAHRAARLSLAKGEPRCVVVLPFFFCDATNPSCALPMLALQNHPVELEFKFAADAAWEDVTFEADFVHFSNRERKRLVQKPLKIPVRLVRVQHLHLVRAHNDPKPIRMKRPLNVNGPIEAIVVRGPDDLESVQMWFNGHAVYEGSPASSLEGGLLELFLRRGVDGTTDVPKGMFSKVFAPRLDPWVYSGSLNASMVDGEIELTYANSTSSMNKDEEVISVYFVSWNVLQCTNGTGGLTWL